MQLLHIDSSIQGGNSVSRDLSAAAVAQLKSLTPDINVVYRDLVEHPVPHLTGEYLAAGQGTEAQHSEALQEDLALGETLLEEFLAADIVVIGVAQYNFSVPSQLKAWVDRVAVAGKTFRYTESGPEGLVGDKRVVLAVARGGFYDPGTPTEHLEHTVHYLTSILGFFGITKPQIITADGTVIGPDQREKSIDAAKERIAGLKATA